MPAGPSPAIKFANANGGLSSLLLTVNPVIIHSFLSCVQVLAFSILRPFFKNIYEPRTKLEKSPRKPLPDGFFHWPIALFLADYEDIKEANGLDAYFFTRLLRVLSKILFPVWIVTWAVLLPIDLTRKFSRGRYDVNRLTITIIADDNTAFPYISYILLYYAFTAWVLYNLKVELRSFIQIRQDYLTKTRHAETVQARTILVGAIPPELRSEDALKRLFSKLPGGVEHIEFNRKLYDARKIFMRRRKAEDLYESGATKYIRRALKHRPQKDTELGGAISWAERYRPGRRTLGKLWRREDKMKWAREEIKKCNEQLRKIDEMARPGGNSDVLLSSAFITFREQLSAHLAVNCLTHHNAYEMTEKWIEVDPSDVIWTNLDGNPYSKRVCLCFSLFVTAILVLVWLIPVGAISIFVSTTFSCNYQWKPSTPDWAAYLCQLQPIPKAILEDVVPAIILRILFILPPIILRALARFEGKPKLSALELSLVNRYFMFHFINSFLAFLLASIVFIIIKAEPIHDGSRRAHGGRYRILAEKLTAQSYFWIGFIVQEGLTLVGGGYLRMTELINHFVKMRLHRRNTPRAMFNTEYTLNTLAWGTAAPEVCLIVVIAFTYSVVSPIMNAFACICFYLMFQLNKYRFLWVYNQKRAADTGGLFYPKALRNIFVGLYMHQLILLLLFVLLQKGRWGDQTPARIVFTVLLSAPILVTGVFHSILNHSYGPLARALPLTKFCEEPEVLVAEELPSLPDPTTTSIEEVQKAELATPRPKYNKRLYAHPVLHDSQRPIWIPKDDMGLAAAEVETCTSQDVKAICQGASINQQGVVTLLKEELPALEDLRSVKSVVGDGEQIGSPVYDWIANEYPDL